MMYVEKFVCSLKVDGRFLRDESGVVKIPFGTDYTLYLKNIDSRDAVVKVSIDGKDVLDGNRLVVRSNSSMELLGFMNGQEVKNKFRFIELTQEIENRLGYSPEDSLIRIEVWYEKAKPIVQEISTIYTTQQPWWYYPYYHYDYNFPHLVINGTRTVKGLTNDVSVFCSSAQVNASYTSDVGITVGGKDCQQNFGSTYVGDLESQSHVIILRLSGYKDANNKVETVFTTKDKVECPTCGKKNEYSDKFCSNCGTFLK